jgi:broad specificity phosphatase PhoE
MRSCAGSSSSSTHDRRSWERPRREWRLSEEGVDRCVPLASHLGRYGPTRIVTSPEPKAHETALAVAGALGYLPVETLEGLREHDDGDVPFQSEPAFRDAVAAFFVRPGEATFGPETADAAYTRFSSAISTLATPGDGQSVVAVAHGRVISLFAARRNDLDPYALWARLGLPGFVVLELPEYRVEEIVDRAW